MLRCKAMKSSNAFLEQARRYTDAIFSRYWRSRRTHRIELFSDVYIFSNRTSWSFLRAIGRPRADAYSDIVNYADHVQWHSIGAWLLRHAASIDRPVFIDVGASVGVYAVLLGKFAAKYGGKVLAFEPEPAAFDILSENIRLNGLESVVTCIPKAVSSEKGVANLNVAGPESALSAQGAGGPQVEVTTLRDAVEEHGVPKIDLLIVDVEGCELRVLQGCPWDTHRPGRIYCELHPYAWREFGYDGKELQQFFAKQQLMCIDTYLNRLSPPFSEYYIGPTVLIPR